MLKLVPKYLLSERPFRQFSLDSHPVDSRRQKIGVVLKKIDIREVLSQELSVHGAVEGENLSQRGPEIPIPAKQAQVLSMAIHELATNAVKHGALSVENGRIEISWDAHVHSNGKELRLRWRERGRPIAHEPVRRGFGSEFLEKSVPHMLHGQFKRTFRSDGVECTLSFFLD